jgi:hypothetical protein
MRAVSAARTFQDHLVRACAAIRRSWRSYHMQEAGSLFENRPLPLAAEASSYQRSSSSVVSLRLSYPGPAKPVVVTVLVNRDPPGVIQKRWNACPNSSARQLPSGCCYCCYRCCICAMRVCAWPQGLLQVRCPALGLSVSVSGEGWSLGSITAATRPIKAINARTTMAIP